MRTKRHMKLPNGFGQITKLKANLRKPYRAMITVGIMYEPSLVCEKLKGLVKNPLWYAGQAIWFYYES